MGMPSLGDEFNSRNNSMNIMRMLAALAVIYGHASAVTGHGPADLFLQLIGYKFIGGVAVDVFFVLSGFLITASAMSRKGLKYFIASRILRIYPGLLVCVLLTVFVLGPLLTVDQGYWQSLETWWYLINNTTTYRTEYFLPGVFSDLHDRAINGSLWSLKLEVRLYLTLAIAYLIGIFSEKRVFNAIFFAVMLLGYFAPDFISTIFGPKNHCHVAMMFIIGSFAWINKDSIPMGPELLFILLMFAASMQGTDKFGYAYALLLPYLVFYVAVGRVLGSTDGMTIRTEYIYMDGLVSSSRSRFSPRSVIWGTQP